jgi:YD repeat-containing protein
MEKAESGSGPVTGYQYDAAGRLEKVTQGSRVREFFYSTAGWMYKAVNPESGTIEYDYTPGGRMLSRKDALGRRMCMGTLSGSTCTASLDASGRPLRKSYSDGTPTVTYSYSGERLEQVTNAAAKVTYEYDLLDRVVTREQEVDGVTYTHGRRTGREDWRRRLTTPGAC